MFASSSASLVALVLLVGASVTAQPRLPACEASPSRLELPPEPTSEPREVCISPELPTTFRFDSSLAPGTVEVQGRERFEDVSAGTRSFTVLPPADLQTGECFKVEVRFADGAAPTSATFILVGHPALGTRQVDVYRLKRGVEDYQKQIQQEREKPQQLSQELERMRLEHGPGGLTGLIASGLIALADKSVAASNISKNVTLPASNAITAQNIISYRSRTTAGVVRVAVAMKLLNLGTQP